MSPQLGNQKAQLESQDTPKQAPPEGNEALAGKTEVPKYTEKQWSAMRHKMQSKINDLETTKGALESQVEDKDTNEEILREKLGKLQQEIDEGIPEDTKEVTKKYRERSDKLTEWEVKRKREFRKAEEAMAERNEEKRMELVQTLSEKYGVDADELLKFKDPKDMKAYALDNFDISKVVKPKEETGGESPGPEIEKLEKPVVPGMGAGGGTKTTFTQGEIDSMDVKTFAQHREAVLKALTGGKVKD